MPDLNSWLANRDKLEFDPANTKAINAWNRINRNPIEIIIHRKGVDLPAQTVRIEQNLRVREDEKPSATTGVSIAVLFGILGHPTLPDTDVQPRDRFFVSKENVMYEVITVNVHPGEIQAICEARFG